MRLARLRSQVNARRELAVSRARALQASRGLVDFVGESARISTTSSATSLPNTNSTSNPLSALPNASLAKIAVYTNAATAVTTTFPYLVPSASAPILLRPSPSSLNSSNITSSSSSLPASLTSPVDIQALGVPVNLLSPASDSLADTFLERTCASGPASQTASNQPIFCSSSSTLGIRMTTIQESNPVISASARSSQIGKTKC
ncbi:unnamed protein product [Protopolystoma xenopodis]|uniref:Uncharacterized protein n=1 Tax=Protopolystoma xenopodis TaxID=117903 RepID=A0A3S5AIZ2_9PLAT|nr:unnamed protein product [Protopolystoma xenopodis]